MKIPTKMASRYHLGEDHPYTKELGSLGTDLAPYFLGNYI